MTKEKRRAWRKANPEKHRAEQALYRKRHPYRNRKRLQEYHKRNLEKYVVYQAIRRAKKFESGGKFTPLEFNNLCKFYKYRCLCCGKKKKLTADHVIPISKGGSSSIDNIQPLCSFCNNSKFTRTIDFRLRENSGDSSKCQKFKQQSRTILALVPA